MTSGARTAISRTADRPTAITSGRARSWTNALTSCRTRGSMASGGTWSWHAWADGRMGWVIACGGGVRLRGGEARCSQARKSGVQAGRKAAGRCGARLGGAGEDARGVALLRLHVALQQRVEVEHLELVHADEAAEHLQREELRLPRVPAAAVDAPEEPLGEALGVVQEHDGAEPRLPGPLLLPLRPPPHLRRRERGGAGWAGSAVGSAGVDDLPRAGGRARATR